MSSIAQKADRKNWSPDTRERKLEKNRIAKKVHFQFCAFLFVNLNKCVTFYILQTHKEKTGAVGQAATLAEHRVYNARPDVIARNQDHRDNAGYAGHVVTDAVR